MPEDTRNSVRNGGPPGKVSLESLETQAKIEYRAAKAFYYRYMLRKQDEDVFRKLQKIPDDWQKYSDASPERQINITGEQQKRLSDMKKLKSWELKFESLNLYYLINIEDVLMECLSSNDIGDDELYEGIDSANSILTEIGSNISNFKYLLLSLARRAVSDFYYLMLAYEKFNKRREFIFEGGFQEFLTSAITIMTEHRAVIKNVESMKKYSQLIQPLFPKSSNQAGWKMDEFAVKKFIEEKTVSGEKKSPVIELRSIVSAGYLFKKKLKDDYDFIKYYYNDHDGKMYRYNYITEMLSQKLKEGKISAEVFSGFELIRKKFTEIKEIFEIKGLLGFGPRGMNYLEVLEFVYKCAKIIEFFYLRSMRYDDLQTLRNKVLYYVENEFMRIKSKESS